MRARAMKHHLLFALFNLRAAVWGGAWVYGEWDPCGRRAYLAHTAVSLRAALRAALTPRHDHAEGGCFSCASAPPPPAS